MKTFKNIIFAGLLCCGMIVTITACSTEDYLGGHYVTDGAGTLMSITAKISAQSNPALTWTEGDKIGVATSYGLYDASARNREYVCQTDGVTFSQTSGYPIYVKGNTTIVAYYPFVGSNSAEPALTLLTRDQSAVDSYDYLFAKVEGISPQNGSNVNLVFDYALARLSMNIVAPAEEQIISYRLSGLAHEASVDPYTLDMKLSAPEDLTGAVTDNSISLKLIPQTITQNAAVPVQLILIGNYRSYTIDMSDLSLAGGAVQVANVNVTDGIGTIEFVPNSASWNDSGVGGSVSSK